MKVNLGAPALIYFALLAGCGGGGQPTAPSAPSGPTVIYRADVTDSGADGTAVGFPDLTRATIEILSDRSMRVRVELATATLDPESTWVTIELDTDRNVLTGVPGFIGLGGAVDLGVDHRIEMGSRYVGPNARLTLYPPVATLASAATVFTSSSMETTFPLGSLDGRMNFRVLVSRQLSNLPSFTRVLDEVPDHALGPGRVQ